MDELQPEHGSSEGEKKVKTLASLDAQSASF